ncbi:hypothetical protein Btru_023566 [Bulinus truncatus]|nr:hypothetical protein Btru_023566 [Bulinus truncatus]
MDMSHRISIESDVTSEENLLPKEEAVSIFSHPSESDISIRRYDVARAIQLLIGSISPDSLSSLVHPYKISETDGIYTHPKPGPPPPLPSRPPTIVRESASCRHRRKNKAKDLNCLFKSLIAVCVILMLLLMGVIVVALKFYFDSNDCASPAATQQVRVNYTRPEPATTTTEIHCCCAMCRETFSTVYQNNRIDGTTTSPATNVQFERTADNPTDVCVFGSACARVGIGIPHEMNHCAKLEDDAYIPLNDSLENRHRQNRKGITVHKNNSIDIKTTGTYMVHSRLAYNPNCSSLCPTSQNKNFIHKVLVYRIVDRHNTTKDQELQILTGHQMCCQDCKNHSGISYVRGIFTLLKNDDIFIKTNGPELINYSHVSSFLEVVLLKEGSDDTSKMCFFLQHCLNITMSSCFDFHQQITLQHCFNNFFCFFLISDLAFILMEALLLFAVFYKMFYSYVEYVHNIIT